MDIKFLPGECWFGGCVKYGMDMPLTERSEAELDFTNNPTPNQSMPLLLSTKGRYLWSDAGFRVRAGGGWMSVPDETELAEGFDTLRGAYLAAMREHFPFSSKTPAASLFEKIIYNTWIELLFSQNQKDILNYAQGILESGMEPGVLMIDDGWAESYGDWRFHSGRFPDAAAMLDSLHAQGFDVMVWISPFVSSDTETYREARDRGLLIREKSGEPYIVKWWNGYSAVLDLSNPAAAVWLRSQLEELRRLGVDGFKFDGGDSVYYREDLGTFADTTPDEQSALWAQFGRQYAFNEYRAAAKAGGWELLQRLCDKEHSWGRNGVASLVPDMLAQGITGYPYGCPDMVGGGEYLNFLESSKDRLDEELFVRHCEIACLMPAVQFSAAPWRVLCKENFQRIKNSLQFRKKYLPYLLEQIRETAKTGEPLIRYLCYEFPGDGAEQVTDQFMLGSRYLAAPVCRKGERGRMVFLPKGQWKYGGQIFEGNKTQLWLESEPGIPIVLERMSEP